MLLAGEQGDGIPFAIVFVDASGQVMSVDDEARAILEREDSVRLSDGELRFLAPPLQEYWRGVCQRLAVGETVETQLRIVPRLVGRPHLMIVREPFATSRGVGAVLLFSDGEGDSQRLSPRLVEAMGLTPAEALVAEQTIRRHGVVQIASELGLSEHTVRTHLRHIFDKLEVRSQQELTLTIARAGLLLRAGQRLR